MNELKLLASRDKIFLDFANSVILYYSSLQKVKYPKLNDLKEFSALVTRKQPSTSTYALGEDKAGTKITPLFRLLDKIHTMIYYKPTPISVIPMLERMVTKGVKTQTHRESFARGTRKEGDEGETYGKGHFRWDWKAYTLSDIELKAIRMYLGIPDPVKIKPLKGKYKHSFKYNHINIELVGKFVRIAQNFAKNFNSYQYEVSIRTELGTITIPYFSGAGALKAKRKDLLPSDLLDCLNCYLLDASYTENSFEDFMSDLGYENECEARKDYERAVNDRANLKIVFGNIELDVLREKVEHRAKRVMDKERFGGMNK